MDPFDPNMQNPLDPMMGATPAVPPGLLASPLPMPGQAPNMIQPGLSPDMGLSPMEAPAGPMTGLLSDPAMMGAEMPMGGMPPIEPQPLPPVDPMAEMVAPPPPMLPVEDPNTLVPGSDPIDPQIGPVWEDWYRKPARPKADAIQAEAEKEKSDHAGRIQIAMEMRRRLGTPGDTFGYFAQDAEALAMQQIEPAPVSALRDEHDLACSYGMSMDVGIDALNRNTLIDKEEMQAKEDLSAYLFECERRQHSRSGNGSLMWALFDTIQTYGMLVGFDGLDPADHECGLAMRMVDPATVFPVHEGKRGLSQLYRCYQATASSVIGDFDDRTGSIAKKVKKIAKGEHGRMDPHYIAEVIEYWDRNWVCVLFDGKEILCREHGYARVPFTVTYGCFGQQGFTSTTDSFNYIGDNTGGYILSASGVAGRNRQEDLMRIAQPFLWRKRKTHDMEEAVNGLLVTALRRAINPPVIHYRSLLSIGQGDLEIDRSEGGYTQAGEDDKFEPFPTIPSPEIITPVIAYLQQNRMTGTPTGVLSGQMPSSQTSGSAIDILGSMGFQRWNPLVKCVEQFIEERMEWRLSLIRDWGEILGASDDLGTLTVPRRKPNPRTGNASAHNVTPKMLRDTGIRVKVEMRRFDPTALNTVGNGLMILLNSGLIDRRRAIKIAGFADDPDSVIQDIDMDELNAVPEVKQEKTLRMLKVNVDQAKARGDWESAIELEQAMYFIASVMEQRASIGQPALGPDGQRLKPMPGQGAPDVNMAAQGLSMPMMGIPTGTEGGRPPGM
jgi:hypothetical protein